MNVDDNVDVNFNDFFFVSLFESDTDLFDETQYREYNNYQRTQDTTVIPDKHLFHLAVNQHKAFWK